MIYTLSVYNKKEKNNAITVSSLFSQFLKFLMKIISLVSALEISKNKIFV
jgi:hypothetical protein